jgi:methionine-rich copper-binding protein CopC
MVTRFFGAAIVVIALVSPAWAHEQSLHHQKPTSGAVETVNGEHLTLKTDDATISVTLSDRTHVEAGEKEVGRDALRPGTHVSVYGTKLPGGEIVASDIHVEDQH